MRIEEEFGPFAGYGAAGTNEYHIPMKEADAILAAKDHEIKRLRAALAFYADPWAHTERVPEFYRELDFGRVADDACKKSLTSGG